MSQSQEYSIDSFLKSSLCGGLAGMTGTAFLQIPRYQQGFRESAVRIVSDAPNYSLAFSLRSLFQEYAPRSQMDSYLPFIAVNFIAGGLSMGLSTALFPFLRTQRYQMHQHIVPRPLYLYTIMEDFTIGFFGFGLYDTYNLLTYTRNLDKASIFMGKYVAASIYSIFSWKFIISPIAIIKRLYFLKQQHYSHQHHHSLKQVIQETYSRDGLKAFFPARNFYLFPAMRFATTLVAYDFWREYLR